MAEYDTNVVGGSDAAAAIKGLQKDDIRYTATATISGSIPVGPGSVYITGNIGYVFHQNNPELNTPTSSIHAGIADPVKLGPCSLSVILGYSATPSDPSQLLLQTLKNTQTLETFGGSAQCSTGGAVGENLSVTHMISSNSAKLGTRDSSTTAVSAGVSYQNRALGNIMFSGSYSTSDYGTPDGALTPAQAATAVHGFDSYTASVGITRPFGSRLSGSANLGYNLSKPVGGGTSSRSTGLTGSGSLAYRLNSRISATLGYSRVQSASIQVGSSFSTIDDVSLNASYAFSQRITTSVGYHVYRRQEHIDDPTLFVSAGGLLAGATRETGNGQNASVSMRIGRNGALSLNLGRTYRNTNLTVYNYTDYTAGLSLSERF